MKAEGHPLPEFCLPKVLVKIKRHGRRVTCGTQSLGLLATPAEFVAGSLERADAI